MPTLDWIGKRAVLNHHREIPFRLLREELDLSVGEESSSNLLIEGDNLHALKSLVPLYARQVKVIYIDPPYNTGVENWVYNDAVNSPEIREWLGKVVGDEAIDLTRHDKWLCMMFPRLQLLRQFLRDDGMIFVSIDNNEMSRLAVLMDEIFGARNHVETLIWKKSYGGGSKSKHFVNQHEYILCYARSIDKLAPLKLPPDTKASRYYKFTDDQLQIRGPYRLQPLATNSMDPRPNLRYPIPHEGEEIWPEKQWQWSKERALAALDRDELVIKRGRGARWSVSYKQYLRDQDGEERAGKPFSIIDGIYTQQGTNEIKAMFGDGKKFSFPKPRALIEHLLLTATEGNDLILDSFAGSGTTGHAVLNLNLEDGGCRRFILIEMDPGIARDVALARLSLAVDGYLPAGETDEGERVAGLGGGFHVFRLGDPIFNENNEIRQEVGFRDLARYVFFLETGTALADSDLTSSLLGIHDGRAVYLLFNVALGEPQPHGGNVLTGDVLSALPRFDGEKVIYAASCRLGSARLERERIVFKQIPYDMRVG